MEKNLNSKDRLWGISAILIGLAGLVSSLALVVRPVIFPQAGVPNQPQAVRLSNFSENSITVSWVTNEPVIASVAYADNQRLANAQTAFDDRGENVFSRLHHITLKNLEPGANYYFQLVSGGQEFNYQGQPYSSRSPGHLASTPLPPVIFTDNLESEALVYFQYPDSTLISTVADTSGAYLLTLNNALTEDQTSYYPAVSSQNGSFTFHDGEKTWNQGAIIRQLADQAEELPAPEPARKQLIALPQNWRQKPQADEVKAANVTDSSLSIAWLTDQPTQGSIAISAQSNRLLRFFEFFSCQYFGAKCQLFADEMAGASATHFVTLKNLEPETSYYYRLVAGSHFLKYDQQGEILPAIKTAAVLEQPALPQPVFGPVFEADGATPIENALVYLNLLDGKNRNIIKSQPIMTFTDRSGVWLADLGNLRGFDQKTAAQPESGDLLFIKVWAPDGRQTAEFMPYSGEKAMRALIVQ